MPTAAPRRRRLADFGPGLAMAATGVGAGDLAAAAFAGARFGESLLWAVAGGAIVKLFLNEGIARWQLATGTPLLEGWCRHTPRAFSHAFLVYLVVWTLVVGGALMSACGIATHALVPALPIPAGGVLHSVAALALVLWGRYAAFERAMTLLAVLMVIALLASVAFLLPDPRAVLRGLFVPTLPTGAAPAALGLLGGIGGSVSLLAYGYWIRERGWSGRESLGHIRTDLAVAYVLTGLFGMSVLVLSAQALGQGAVDLPSGSRGLVLLAATLRDSVAAQAGAVTGEIARVVFLLGVWGAVFTSVLGVWQGIPYLFADFLAARAGRYGQPVDVTSRAYRGYLLYVAIAPMALLAIGRPFWLILVYTVVSSAFLPFLASSLLWLNSRRTLVGHLRNGVGVRILLALVLVLVAVLAFQEVWDTLGG